MRVVIDPHSLAAYEGVPVMTMGKKAMSPWMDGETRISEYHGHIHYENGTLVSHTFDAGSVVKQPNYLPLVTQEISNLLQATRNPALLSQPVTHRELPPFGLHSAVLDLEWDSKNRITIVGFSEDPTEAFSTTEVVDGLGIARRLLYDGQIIGHNIISADLPHVGKPRSLDPEVIFDTKLAAHIVHPHFAGQGLYDLGSLCRFYFPLSDWKHDQHDGLTYNGLDCAHNYRLYLALKRDLEATGQMHLMQEEQELHSITCAMRDRGIRVDENALAAAVNEKSTTKNALKSGFTFNPNSGKQIIKWLRDTYRISVNDTTAHTLVKLRGKNADIDKLIDYRVDSKSISTWFDFEADDGGLFVSCPELIHPKFDATGTNVARLSSSGPNFQNIPPSLRSIIVPRSEDLEFLSMDAKQAENRWVAFYAEDDRMMEGFDSGVDNHQRVADAITAAAGFECDRNMGKTVVHASNYGETVAHLAERIFGNRKREAMAKATALQKAYFDAYPKTRKWQLDMAARLDSGDLKLVNAYGRVRWIYAIDSHERKKRGCHYMGCSSAADMVNRKVTQIHRELGLVPILIVHDEIVYEVGRGDLKIRAVIAEILRQPVVEQGGRPGAWDMKAGRNYGKWSKSNLNGLKGLE